MSISITQDQLSQLQKILQERKFSKVQYYPGAPTEAIRSECERRVNEFVREVVSLLERGTERGEIFARARVLTEAFGDEDTEEREKVDDYIGETMGIIGLEDWTEHV